MDKITADNDWKGYTLEQIRFQRLVALAKAEIGKTYMTTQVKDMTSGHLIKSPMVTKIAGALNYFDYAMLAYRLFRSLSRTFKK